MCLTPYVDGVSARRSSMMAVMEHGVPIVSTTGHLTDAGLFDNSPRSEDSRFWPDGGAVPGSCLLGVPLLHLRPARQP